MQLLLCQQQEWIKKLSETLSNGEILGLLKGVDLLVGFDV